MNDEQVKHMVNRFLGWRLPDNFSPDAGISFKPTFNDHMPFGPQKHNPTGTNLFGAQQAESMVRYLLEGLPDYDILRAENEALKKALEETLATNQHHCGMLSQGVVELAVLRAENDALKKQYDDLLTSWDDSRAKLATCRAELAEAQAERSKTVLFWQKDCGIFHKHIDDLEAENKALQAELAQAETDYANLVSSPGDVPFWVDRLKKQEAITDSFVGINVYLKDRIRELELAICTYGAHRPSCPRSARPPGAAGCTCGLHSLLSEPSDATGRGFEHE